ncbi:GDP-L-fucose synthase [Lachnospiraceae bacterium]|nr:GDP-L-fucose synthase [Lachnospiraceae bacterium]
MNLNEKICVIGHSGVLGHAIVSELTSIGYSNIVCCSRSEVDCTNQAVVDSFFEVHKPSYVFFLAAISAGIEYKRKYPVEVLLQNMQMEMNVISSAHNHGVKRLLNVSSALLYPSTAAVPIDEKDATFTNLNEIDTPYSLAKAAGMQLCNYYRKEYNDDFFTVIPCNFFGEYAAFNGDKAGVVPSLIRRILEAKEQKIGEVVVWGTGRACREFLNSKDVASACVFLMNHEFEYPLINIGRGEEFSIREIAETIKEIIGYKGKLIFDADKPEGRLHMQLNTEKIFSLGWKPSMNLRESVENAYRWFIDNREFVR